MPIFIHSGFLLPTVEGMPVGRNYREAPQMFASPLIWRAVSPRRRLSCVESHELINIAARIRPQLSLDLFVYYPTRPNHKWLKV